MSKFNSYAKKVNNIATAAFEEYLKAEKAYKAAEEKAREYPQRNGIIDAAYAAKSARAQADFLDAKNNMAAAKKEFESHQGEIKQLRKELAAEIETEYTVDPTALDNNTLELMKSGILKPHEYKNLLEKAKKDNNHTMARMIAKYAGDAADVAAKKYGDNDTKTRDLRYISYTEKDYNGSEYLQNFDYLADVYSKAVNNPGMIKHWAELTEAAVENF
jgi:hypothetical protein